MRDKIRILNYYPPAEFDTGSPKAMVNFIQSLDRAVFEPVYCMEADGPLVEALAVRGVEIVRGQAASVTFRRPFAALAAIRRQSALLKSWRIDVLHAHGFFWNTDLILAAWALRIPVVLHVHNPETVAFQNLNRLAARRVLFCSCTLMDNCDHLRRVASKAEVLHNTIDIGAMGRGSSIRAGLGLNGTDIAIGTVAQVTPRKGIDILLETARILLRERSDLVFFVAGPTPPSEEAFGRRMRAAAEEPDLRGRVRFLGSRSDIPDFLASLDLFLLPARAEPFGIVVIEAMAASLPVIASKVGGIPEILSAPEIGRLVDPITPEAFAAAIREILALPDHGKSLGAKARLSLAGRFDMGAAGERLKRIYLDVLRPRHPLIDKRFGMLEK
jgi:glycosyltransferase involved in cell wall biosynthesis